MISILEGGMDRAFRVLRRSGRRDDQHHLVRARAAGCAS